ncbi:MAG: acetyltransferase [Actinomycetota bacterium]|nr:acetyltransferase [Actinomycetota bacterium]
MDLTFRRLPDDDLPLLHAWLNEPGVVRWWEGDDVTWDAVERDYGSASTDPTEYWLATVADEPVGWMQCYLAADYAGEEEADAWFRLGLPRTTGGIDYLVPDPGRRGRGLGSRMIRAFVDDVVLQRHPEWTHVAASPQAGNVASWRALEKAGFSVVGEFDSSHGRCRLFVTEQGRRPTSMRLASATGDRGAGAE